MENIKTALYNLHQKYGAKFVPFAGYQMPVQYTSGIIEEHKLTRTKAGLFDVSHMGQLFIEDNSDLVTLLEKIVPTDLKNILDVNNKPLVSSDFNHNPHSAIVDLSLTKVVENKMAKISAWYDNEWGFACRMCDLANYFGKI